MIRRGRSELEPHAGVQVPENTPGRRSTVRLSFEQLGHYITG